ncbi:MAG: antibiotic resistance protein MarC [Candidatus Nephthysia bennettiae]|nr:MAG: antibiotic resistance protein MarC [Candidatus Dormibacteraeota bacterium]
MNWLAFSETFVTLFVIMDPIGTAPIFVSLTAAQSPRARRLAALQAAATAGGLVHGFSLFGRLVLTYLNVSVQSLAIAGGLLLLLLALQMFRGAEPSTAVASNVAVVPLATPLLAGPGAIAAIMVLSDRHSDLGGRLAVVAGVVAIAIVVAAVFLLAGHMGRFLRPVAVVLLTQVLALLLAAISIQLIVDAVRSLISTSQ